MLELYLLDYSQLTPAAILIREQNVCYPFRYSAGVIPVSRLKNFEKNEGLGKFNDSAICQTGRSLLRGLRVHHDPDAQLFRSRPRCQPADRLPSRFPCST